MSSAAEFEIPFPVIISNPEPAGMHKAEKLFLYPATLANITLMLVIVSTSLASCSSSDNMCREHDFQLFTLELKFRTLSIAATCIGVVPTLALTIILLRKSSFLLSRVLCIIINICALILAQIPSIVIICFRNTGQSYLNGGNVKQLLIILGVVGLSTFIFAAKLHAWIHGKPVSSYSGYRECIWALVTFVPGIRMVMSYGDVFGHSLVCNIAEYPNPNAAKDYCMPATPRTNQTSFSGTSSSAAIIALPSTITHVPGLRSRFKTSSSSSTLHTMA